MSSAVAPTTTSRAQLLKALFPDGVPPLWCPLLTHYREDGTFDAPRIAAHLQHLASHVGGFLIPGSTGDGWQLSDEETNRLVGLVLEPVEKLKLHLLVGVLKADGRSMLNSLRELLDLIKARTQTEDAEKALARARVCGFTVCAPRGAERSQKEIEQALGALLEEGLPTALYQLPQVTQNEISPEVLESLAMKYQNFTMFKDSSWKDRVALSGKNLRDVFMMRGAEGDYAKWLKTASGSYDGFLLSTANCFGAQLHQMIQDTSRNRLESARRISEVLSLVIDEVFAVVRDFPQGNPFANANKAMDHFFAHGPHADEVPPPRLHGGSQLPVEMIRQTGEILSRHYLMPVKGYLA
jgi:dihydrodipicolinate synthase/N-acetylneuraminate lyase